ncbi:MAG: alpha/beta hydrolase [Bacteroidota bacterium]|nr:alpha/beta hydrolase [Bacteroidota bacterium]
MQSLLITPGIEVSGNITSGNSLLFSDIFNLFPDCFQTISPRFKDDYQIVLYTDSGFLEDVQNRKLRHLTMSCYADDLIACLEKNGIKNITYVAHSVNALLAFIAAYKAPHLFSKIVLISAVPCLLQEAETECACGFPSLNADELFKKIMQKQTDEHKAATVQFTDVLATAFAHKTEEEARAIFQVLFSTDCRNFLNDFPVPTVILQVTADKMATTEAGYFMYRSIPSSQLVRIKAKGQMPYLNEPEEIVKAMKFFTQSALV